MIVETGHFALILAFAVACLQCGGVAWSAWSRDASFRALAAPAAVAQFALLSLAFLVLIRAYVLSDFSVAYANGPDPGTLEATYGGVGLPYTVFVDAEGTIARTWIGPLDEQRLTTTIDEIA